MIYSVSGEVVKISLDYAVVETCGVGYLVYSNSATLNGLHVGQDTVLYTLMVVREDSMSLYGFATFEEREVFNVLLGVSGVGPKLALACLNAHTVDSFCEAVVNGDLKALEKIPGVGKKSAQRMILDIGNKLGSVREVSVALPSVVDGVAVQVVQALVQLGWSQTLAENSVHEVSKTGTFSDVSSLLKASLVFLGGNNV